MKPHPSACLFLFILAFTPGHPIHAQGVRRTIEPMGFRSVSEEDLLLGKRYSQKEAFFSLRPPAGWSPKKSANKKASLEYAVRFEDPKTKDILSVGLTQGGPKTLSIETLSRFRGDYLSTVRKSNVGRIIGSDLFRFKNYNCLQVMIENKNNLVLQLLVFDQPGSFIQMVYSIDKSHYRGLARAIEASIASLEWPNL